MDKLEKTIKGLECCRRGFCFSCPYNDGVDENVECKQMWADDALSLLKAHEPGWKPFVKRPLTEEEKKIHPEWCYILDGDVPEDEQEILLYRPWRNASGYIIEMDRYCNNGDECYLEGAGDIENGMWWMPLPSAPEPPKEET